MAERVMVFIDGQNIYKGLKRARMSRVHPILLGRELAGDRELVEVRYYTGMHLPRENAKIHALTTRRNTLIRRTGVTVIERTLRYHWEWGIDDRLPPAYRADDGETHKVTVSKHRSAREKGIDLALGLDAATAALTGAAEVIIIASADRDLMEVAAEVKERAAVAPGAAGRVRMEVAMVQRSEKRRHLLDGYDYTHWIDEDLADSCADHFDYRSKLPKAEVRAFLASL